MSPNDVEKYISQEHRRFAVAEVNGEILGMIQVLNNNYVGQFFVHQMHQRKGYGSALWRFALEQAVKCGGTGEFTVNSSLAAAPVYLHFGFQATDDPIEEHGWKFIPMRRGADAPVCSSVV
jgi:GNAT superfamily N-acetyltransferase